jgi:uncharacterized protein YkwD
MRKTVGLSLFIASLILTLVPSLAKSATVQDGVSVGRGKVSRKNERRDRSAQTRSREDEHIASVNDSELKPMISSPLLAEIETLEQKCLQEVNRLREAHGLMRLEFYEPLLSVARDYSRRMAEERFFAHTDPDGLTVRQRVDRARIKWRMIGENLAYSNGYTNPVAASVTGWMDSPGHRKNMLDPDFRQTAIGVWISSNGTVYFTEIFIK